MLIKWGSWVQRDGCDKRPIRGSPSIWLLSGQQYVGISQSPREVMGPCIGGPALSFLWNWDFKLTYHPQALWLSNPDVHDDTRSWSPPACLLGKPQSLHICQWVCLKCSTEKITLVASYLSGRYRSLFLGSWWKNKQLLYEFHNLKINNEHQTRSEIP